MFVYSKSKNNILLIAFRDSNNTRSLVDIATLSNSVIIIDNILRSSIILYRDKNIINIPSIYSSNKVKDIDKVENLIISNTLDNK